MNLIGQILCGSYQHL